MFIRNAFRLLVAPVSLALLDGGLTLQGQSTEYWNGNWEVVNEAQLAARRLLSIHPGVWLAAFALWIAAFSFVILSLPRTAAIFVAVLVTIAHTGGALSWVTHRCPYSYQAMGVVTVLVAVLLTITLCTPATKVATGKPTSFSRRRLLSTWLPAAVILVVWAIVTMNDFRRDTIGEDRLPAHEEIAEMQLEADNLGMFDPQQQRPRGVISYFSVPRKHWQPILDSLQPYEALHDRPQYGYTPGGLRITLQGGKQLYITFVVRSDDRMTFHILPDDTWHVGGKRRALYEALTAAKSEAFD